MRSIIATWGGVNGFGKNTDAPAATVSSHTFGSVSPIAATMGYGQDLRSPDSYSGTSRLSQQLLRDRHLPLHQPIVLTECIQQSESNRQHHRPKDDAKQSEDAYAA